MMSPAATASKQRAATDARPAGPAWWVAHPNIVRAVSVAVFLLLWEYFGRRIDPLFLAPPSRIFAAAVELTNNGELGRALMATLYPFIIGMIISVIAGVVLGIAMAQSRLFEYIIDPFVNAFYAIPRIALVPLIMLWAGLDTTGKIVILVSNAVFPVIINTYAGIRDVRGSILEVGKAYGATRQQIFFKILLPSAVPFIMTGIRLTVGQAIIGIIVAEFLTAQTGLGGMIVYYANLFATAKLFVPIIVIGVLGVALTELVQFVERRFSRWRKLEQDRG
ncbi:ABC transporter permease [Bordetella sp. H567]|uniref:ABC transporter permease n=1 Tax=Bordetella sp. H567 TaxID=1697043 RepID=UPI000832ACF2|nr:ABC transporter permease [Bordetella sp. H567]